MRGERLAVAVLASTLAGVVACSSSSQQEGRSAFAPAPCPDDVSALVVAEVTCGWLTVPEDRTRPGRRIRLFVSRVPAPSTAEPREPVFVAGTDVGDVPNLAGIAPMAQRTGRDVIVVHPRGAGRSEPSLACPETAALADLFVTTAADDPAARRQYLAAVAACHARLTDAGVDVAAYDLTQAAADAEDLRVALEIGSWDVTSFGTSSRIALEMLRAAPDSVRAVLLDSPEWPGLDPRAEAVEATHEALDAVLASCAADVGCRTEHPLDATSLPSALAQLQAAPVTVAARGVGVRVDAARLLQVLRHQLRGDSAGGLYRAEGVPSLLSAVLAGRTAELTGLADALVGDDPYCNGYGASCAPDGRGVSGVDLTVLCRDIAPFSAPTGDRAGTDRLGDDAAFARSPYWDVCDSWPVTPGPASVAEPVRSQVPVLAMVGAFNPAVRPDALRSGLAGLDRLTVLVDPAGGHNVMPRTDCLLGLRQRFLDDPTQALDTSCLTTLTPTWP